MADIKCGDARQLLRELKPESVDMVFTDPPYDVITGGSTKTGVVLNPDKGKSFTGDTLHGGAVRPRDYIHDLYRVMTKQSHIYIMSNLLMLEETMRQMRLAGFEIHNLLVWQKNNATPNRWYMKNAEFIIFGRKGPAFTINNPGSKMIQSFPSVPSSERTHPVEKPVAMIQGYVENSTQPGQVVLDPFMGTGSTGLACRAAGRSFIGFESEPVHYFTAAMRLAA